MQNEMRDRQILEYPEKMCEYCCNFDKEHIGMDCTALCKLTMTLAYAEDYGGNCMFYNVPREQIIVPPCKVGDTVYYPYEYGGKILEKTIKKIVIEKEYRWLDVGVSFLPFENIGETVFLTKEEAEQKLKGGADNGKVY